MNRFSLAAFFLFAVHQTAFSQSISGQTSVCLNSTYTYSFRAGSCPLVDSEWTVTGGTIVDDVSLETKKIRWTSTGTKSIHVLGYITHSCAGSADPPEDPRPTATLSVNLVEAPAVSLTSNLPSIACSNTSMTLSCDNSVSAYYKDWQYSTSPSSGYTTFKTTTTSSTTFTFDDEIPSSLIGQVIYFRVRLRPCPSSYLGTTVSGNDNTTFYQAVPDFTATGIAPDFSCETGSVSINNLTYPDGTAYNGEGIVISIQNSGGTRGYSQTHSGQTSYTISTNFLTVGTGYQVIIENTSAAGRNACSSSVKSFSIPAAPTFSANNPTLLQSISCHHSSDIGSSSDGQITVSVNNGKPPFDYYLKKNSGSFVLIKSNDTNSSYNYTSLGAGTYQVRVIDACDSDRTPSGTVTLNEPSAITFNGTNTKVTSDYNGAEISCSTSSDGEITISASGGTGSLQYSVGSVFGSSNIFPGLSAGTYATYVRDSNGCEMTGPSVKITAPSAVVINNVTPVEYNGYNLSCSGGSDGQVSVSASGGTGILRYSIDGGSHQASNVFTGLSSGNHSVRVRDANNCLSGSYSITLTSPPALSVSGSITSDHGGGQALSCYGANDGQITVSGSGGVGTLQFSIDNGINFYSTTVFNSLSSGTYYIKIRDGNGCVGSASDPVVITDPPAIAVTEIISNYNGWQVSCNGEADGSILLDVSGGAGGFTYSWSNEETSKDLSNLGAGTYSVEIIDANGCTFNDSYTITEPFELQATSFTSDFNGEGVSCNGATDGTIDVDITGGTAPYTYSWSNGETTEDLSGIGTGIYSVEITDANNCITEINNIEIKEPAILSLTVSDQLNVDCNGNSTGSITLTSAGGTGTYEYSIDGTTWQTTNTFTGLPAGDYTIDLRDTNGCTTSTTATITEPTVLAGNVFNVIKSTCGENNGSAEASASGGTAGYSYTWRNNLNEVVSTLSTLTNVGGGIYTVTITDVNGCTTTGQANISSADGAQVTFTDIVSTSCFNSSDGQASMNITGSAPFNVEWQNGETGEQATALSPGDNVVTVTDVNGCVVVEVVNIPSPTAIDYTVTSSIIPSCHDSSDGSIVVQASGGSGGYTYSWSTGDTGSSLDNIASGTYNLTITDINGCTLNAEVVLDGVDPVSLNIDNTALPTCVGDADGSITVSAIGGNGGYTYSWNTGVTAATIEQLLAGSYEVTVADSKGCTIIETIDLPDPEPFTIDIGDEVEICTGSSYVMASEIDNAIYSWTSDNGFTSTDQEVTLSEQGTYNLHVTNADGCEAEDSFTLIVSDDLLNADFLMATEAYVGDTIVIIDISWPIPESLTWQLPTEARVLIENQDYAEVVFDTPGTYAIDMEVSLADCQDFYSQSITILEGRPDAGGRQGEGEELIRKFTAYPNPNDGEFKAEVELSRVEGIRLTLVDLNGNLVVFDSKYSQKDSYEVAVDLPRLRSGIYLLGLQAGGKSKTLRLMVK